MSLPKLSGISGQFKVNAFRYLGKEVAIKSLQAAFIHNRETKLDLKKLREYAKNFRIDIDPYLLALTT